MQHYANNTRNSVAVRFVIAASIVLSSSLLFTPGISHATTLRYVGFDDLVARSSTIVQGRVVKLEGMWGKGKDLAKRTGSKESHSPAQNSANAVALSAASTSSKPVGVGVEGGRMIFTRVTLQTISSIKGQAASTVEFVMAGGTVEGRSAMVAGMPKFDMGQNYLVFLREGYAVSANPVVGVNQGFFRVVQDASGREIMLDANSDHVIGIQGDRVLSRRNPNGASAVQSPEPRLVGPPTPDDPGVRVSVSPELNAATNFVATPMSLDHFVGAIRSMQLASAAKSAATP